MALEDRDRIADYIAEDNPVAAADLDEDFEKAAANACRNPKLYKAGRVRGTREIVVRPSYVMVYRVLEGKTVEVLRVLNAAQQWPPAKA